MTRLLPQIAPCPCGNDKVCVSHWLREWNVFCGVCDRRGEAKKTRSGAVDSWNADWNRRAPVDVEAAERRGAMAAVAWLLRQNEWGLSQKLERDIERGEVLPTAKQRKGAKRT
jgi:hypothetical protein